METGEAVGAPALNPIDCFEVEHAGGMVKVTGKKVVDLTVSTRLHPSSVVIVGAGAAGAACADKLREKGYTGPVTLIADQDPVPVDRPNLSKDYLAGTAQEEWVYLRSAEHYAASNIELVAGDPAIHLNGSDHRLTLKSGRKLDYGALLLATGAEPRTLPIDGAGGPGVHRLRTLADSNAIIDQAKRARTCAVIGASFIGLEVAASLRSRGLDVSVVGPETTPLERTLGSELGRFIQKHHEAHGVRFILNNAPRSIRDTGVELADGQFVDAEMVVLGVGVKPRTGLAESAGLLVENGIIVDEMLRTNVPGVYAAGDVARYPEPVSGERARIEHWVLAERQGQAVAHNMLGIGKPFGDAPFFWSQHYDITISYVGYGAGYDHCEVKGDLHKFDASAIYRKGGKVVAVATIGRDRLSLQIEAALEAASQSKIESVLQSF
jgi:NADPH-dependent 2,4-dienoyl-CoA reductase/sulfur reductase-like enzyme